MLSGYFRHVISGEHKAFDYLLRILVNPPINPKSVSFHQNKRCISTYIYDVKSIRYAITTPASTFKEIQNQTNSNDVARMAGARMVKSIEVKEGAVLNEERIKSLTGGDRVSARFLYGEYFEFQPSCKIWIATNNKPRIFGTDNAIWRRIRLIPFQVTFPPEEQDKELLDKLTDELSGILNWAVEGCLQWQKVGLDPPERIKREIAMYREESNPLVPFLEEETVTDPEGKIKSSDFYQHYKCWCQKKGEHSVSNTQFGRRLSEMGYQKKKNSHIYYLGIKLKASS